MPKEEDIQMEPVEDTTEKIVENLEELNKTVIAQRSFSRVFMTGVVYGIGFVIGSSILAAVVLALIARIFGELPFISDLWAAVQGWLAVQGADPGF